MMEEMQKEEERQAKLRKPDEKPPVWQEWPVLSYVSTKLVSNLKCFSHLHLHNK